MEALPRSWTSTIVDLFPPGALAFVALDPSGRIVSIEPAPVRHRPLVQIASFEDLARVTSLLIRDPGPGRCYAVLSNNSWIECNSYLIEARFREVSLQPFSRSHQ